MADNSTTSGDSGRTIDQHLEENGSPGTLRTLRRVRRAKDSQSANPPTGTQLWANAEDAITSRHQQQQPLPQQQRTREQRASAAEQEQVLTAAALRRSAAARARLDGDTDGSIIDSLESLSVMNDGDDTGTFNCCNSLRNAGGHSAIQPVSSDIIDCRFRWRIHRMQDHYLTTPVSSPPCYCYGLRIRSSKPSPSQ